MRMLTPILLLALLPALSGCITMPKGLLTNRVTVTVAMDECQVASRWGAVGIASDVDARDCAAILEAVQLRMLLQATQATQATPATQAGAAPATAPGGQTVARP